MLWTPALSPFLILPYRALWLPCAIAVTMMLVPSQRSFRQRFARHHTLIIGAPLILVIRSALDPGWWLPWIAVVFVAYVIGRLARPTRRWASIAAACGWVTALVLLTRPHAVGPEPGARIDPGAVLVCAGDSLTYGVDTDTDAETYVARLRDALGCTVINAGFPNDCAADLLSRLDRDVLSRDPTAVLVFIGGNDYLYGTPRDELAAHLNAIVGRIRAKGIAVVLVEVPGGIVWNAHAGVYRRVAARQGATLVPESSLRNWFSLDLVARDYLREPFTTDGIHLSPAGATRVGRWLEPYLRPPLEDRSRVRP